MQKLFALIGDMLVFVTSTSGLHRGDVFVCTVSVCIVPYYRIFQPYPSQKSTVYPRLAISGVHGTVAKAVVQC